MKKILFLVVAMFMISCSPVGKCNMSQDQLNRRIERRIKRGMGYNHNCIKREGELKIVEKENKAKKIR